MLLHGHAFEIPGNWSKQVGNILYKKIPPLKTETGFVGQVGIEPTTNGL